MVLSMDLLINAVKVSAVLNKQTVMRLTDENTLNGFKIKTFSSP